MKVIILALATILVLGLSTSAQKGKHVSAASKGRSLAIIGARIYRSPTEEPIDNGVVLIRDGRIIAIGKKGELGIPAKTTVLDCTGLYLTSGFWNSHVHFIELKWEHAATIPAKKLSQQLEDMLTRYGFTTVFDTGSVWAETMAIRKRIESGEANGPRILSAGEILTVRGTDVPAAVMRGLGYLPGLWSEVGSPEEGTKKANQQIRKGVDAVKVYAATTVQSLVQMPPEVVKAIADESHRNHKLALAHPYNAHGLEASINGGVDVLVHTIPNAEDLSRDQVARMKSNEMSLIPTLKLWKVEAVREKTPPEKAEKIVNTGVEQLRRYSQAGGQILFGTDVGYVTDYDPAEEYELMHRAGMTFRGILESLTTAPAKRFGFDRKTGRIAPGFDADLVVLGSDPAIDVKAFSNVRYTLRAGNIIYRSN